MAPASKKSSDVAKETKGRVAKKITKDANKPKRPASAYFIFLESFREEFKKSNPDAKGVIKMTRAAGQKWKALTDDDKQCYVEEQKKRKEIYDAEMADYAPEKSEVVDVDEQATKKNKRGIKKKNVEETVDEEEDGDED